MLHHLFDSRTAAMNALLQLDPAQHIIYSTPRALFHMARAQSQSGVSFPTPPSTARWQISVRIAFLDGVSPWIHIYHPPNGHPSSPTADFPDGFEFRPRAASQAPDSTNATYLAFQHMMQMKGSAARVMQLFLRLPTKFPASEHMTGAAPLDSRWGQKVARIMDALIDIDFAHGHQLILDKSAALRPNPEPRTPSLALSP
jgi:hypothetical protein